MAYPSCSCAAPVSPRIHKKRMGSNMHKKWHYCKSKSYHACAVHIASVSLCFFLWIWKIKFSAAFGNAFLLCVCMCRCKPKANLRFIVVIWKIFAKLNFLLHSTLKVRKEKKTQNRLNNKKCLKFSARSLNRCHYSAHPLAEYTDNPNNRNLFGSPSLPLAASSIISL